MDASSFSSQRFRETEDLPSQEGCGRSALLLLSANGAAFVPSGATKVNTTTYTARNLIAEVFVALWEASGILALRDPVPKVNGKGQHWQYSTFF
jgi:hypothetical protein